MATRPNKATHGTTTYTAEVAAGATNILASDVDGDFTQIYSNIDDSNVPIASLSTNRLKLDAGISTGMIAAGAIVAGPIAPLGITTSLIANLGVTTPKIAINATTPNFVSAVPGAGSAVNVEADIVTLGTFTPRLNARILLLGSLGSAMSSSSNVQTVTVRLYRDVTIIAFWQYEINTQTNRQPGGVSICFVDATTAAPHVYKLAAITSGALVSIAWSATGFFCATELA